MGRVGIYFETFLTARGRDLVAELHRAAKARAPDPWKQAASVVPAGLAARLLPWLITERNVTIPFGYEEEVSPQWELLVISKLSMYRQISRLESTRWTVHCTTLDAELHFQPFCAALTFLVTRPTTVHVGAVGGETSQISVNPTALWG